MISGFLSGMDDKVIFCCLKFSWLYKQPSDGSTLTFSSSVSIQICIYPVFHSQRTHFLYMTLLHISPCIYHAQTGCKNDKMEKKNHFTAGFAQVQVLAKVKEYQIKAFQSSHVTVFRIFSHMQLKLLNFIICTIIKYSYVFLFNILLCFSMFICAPPSPM